MIPHGKPAEWKLGRVVKPNHFSEMQCPCCKQAVNAPRLSVVIDSCNLSKKQAALLKAVWNGNGLPVSSERIFDAMYEDDIDGGPSLSVMHARLKITLSKTRERLKGSGVSIESLGYRQGYRLILGEK